MLQDGILNDLGFTFGSIDVSANLGLVEFSQNEYRFFPTVGGENVYKASPVSFLGREWKILLGVKNGVLLKVCAFIETSNKAEAESARDALLIHCMMRLGEPTEIAPGLFSTKFAPPTEVRPGFIIWDTPDGNAIVQMADVDGTFMLNLFCTSRLVRGLGGCPTRS